MRGDRPERIAAIEKAAEFTPHARGSTPRSVHGTSRHTVYPACAGIDPTRSWEWWRRLGLPRMRGDRPRRKKDAKGKNQFTPHARGSTAYRLSLTASFAVYPACAGIDPIRSPQPSHQKRLPRMRGDRPCGERRRILEVVFTPHARGSTVDWEFAVWNGAVYPACAGIDLVCIIWRLGF